MKAVRESVEGCVDAGVDVLTLFAFSTQNWERPRPEISALMGLLRLYAGKETRAFKKQGVRVKVLGRLDEVDPDTLAAVRQMEDGTTGGDQMQLNLMISYSGRDELVRATQMIAERVQAGEISPSDITDATIEAALFTAGLPDPDLLIRTSGEQRISNFLLWQLAYTEIHTCPVLWPDFDRSHLGHAMDDFRGRNRRFGRVST